MTLRRHRRGPRSRTVGTKQIKRDVRASAVLDRPAPDNLERPRTRGECRGGTRPCPWLGCKHHLYLDISPETGSIKINFPDLEPWDLAQSCSLDIAEAGALTLEEVGQITNLTRERIRQLEVRGLLKIRASVTREEF